MYEYKNADPVLYGILKQFAKENRSNMTQSESILWSYIRKRPSGCKYRRQYIVGDFIVDFICIEKKLVIEVDGGYHSEPRQANDDEIRTLWLNQHGFKVIRFSNEEIVDDIYDVLQKIKAKEDSL